MAARPVPAIFVLACLLVPAGVLAAGDPQPAFRKYSLPNGLEVILHQDRSVPLVAVDVYYHVGSGDEAPGKSGFAHLFEHLMFQGTARTGLDRHLQLLRDLGATDVNGTTNPNRTDYYELVPSHALETALWLESERMGYLPSTLNQQSLDIQREVVRNERRQAYDNVPFGRERIAVNEALYAEGHPYRHLTIGLHEDLEAASLADVTAFFRRWYVPANATLCLAGDFELAEAERLVEKWFGSFPRSERPVRRRLVPSTIEGPRRFTVQDPFARQRRLHLVWHSPALFAPGDAELDILAYALAHSGTGTLWRRLVRERGWASEVTAAQESHQMSSVFHLLVDLDDAADPAAVLAAVDEELERVRSVPLEARELRQAVASVESAVVWGLEKLLARAELLQHYNHYLAQPASLSWDLDRYRSSSPEAVKSVAAAFLRKEARVEILTLPGPGPVPAIDPPGRLEPVGGVPEAAAPELAFPDEPFRREAPPAGAPQTVVQPALQHFGLPNGLQVYLIERHAVPTVSIDLLFESGAVDDPPGKEGLAQLCMGLLDDGPIELTAAEFEAAQADFGSLVEAYSSPEQQGLRLGTLGKHFDASLALWSTALLRPAMRPEDLLRGADQEVARLRQSQTAAEPLALRLFGPVFYGAGHPLGRLATPASLRSATTEDCRGFLRQRIRPEGASLYVAGAVTRQEIESKVGPLLDAWRGKPEPGMDIGPATPPQGRVFFADVPGAQQSQVYVGHPGPPRQAEDYFPTRLMIGILGGGFTSRINMNLRQEKGYTYGAQGYVLYTRNRGTIVASAPVRSDVTRQSILELCREIRSMAEGTVSAEEVEREKAAAILSLPGRFVLGVKALESIRDLVYFGLPLDFYSSFAARIQAVGVAEVQAAARRHLRPGQIRVLVTGDARTVLPGLRELVASGQLGAGALVLLDPDGARLPVTQGD